MRLLKRLLWVALVTVGLGSTLPAQLFVGPNVGGILGRTGDIGVLIYPKNEDWIAASVSGGYTLYGPMYFARRKAECLRQFQNGGWHVRAGARNALTTDHHSNHMWWGADLIYSRQVEQAEVNACDNATEPTATVGQEIDVMSLSLNLGYTWNPLRGKTIYQRFLLDFGLRVSYPFWSSAPPLGQRDYFSGVGFTWLPLRSIAFEPIAVFRWELFHNRYGYSKQRTRTRFKN